MKHYNLVQFAKDNKISTVELAEMIGIGYPTLIKHSSGQTETRKEVFNKIYEFLTKLTENPEKYSLENCPYEARKNLEIKILKLRIINLKRLKNMKQKKKRARARLIIKYMDKKELN